MRMKYCIRVRPICLNKIFPKARPNFGKCGTPSLSTIDLKGTAILNHSPVGCFCKLFVNILLAQDQLKDNLFSKFHKFF